MAEMLLVYCWGEKKTQKDSYISRSILFYIHVPDFESTNVSCSS